MKRAAFLLAMFASTSFAQNATKDAMVKHWKTSGEFTLAVAQAMPAENYSFRPAPEEMSFGQLMAHIGTANVNACANATGMAKPEISPAIAAYQKDTKMDVKREDAVQFLTTAFDFCNKAVAAVTDEQLNKVMGPPARNLTGFEWFWGYFTHTAHHRGQAEVYMRVKGIKPPDYKF